MTTKYAVVTERVGSHCYGTGEYQYRYEYASRRAAECAASKIRGNIFFLPRVMALAEAEKLGATKTYMAVA